MYKVTLKTSSDSRRWKIWIRTHIILSIHLSTYLRSIPTFTLFMLVRHIGYLLVSDKNSNHIYYSIYDFANLLTDEYGVMRGAEHLLDGYYDYDEQAVKVRYNEEGQWFERTAYNGDMRMLIPLDGSLYGVSTGCAQRYSYNSSSTEPFTADLNGVTHLKFDGPHGWLMHTELEGRKVDDVCARRGSERRIVLVVERRIEQSKRGRTGHVVRRPGQRANLADVDALGAEPQAVRSLHYGRCAREACLGGV